eukprot:15456132-Alexandrium_andersonii.AAC.1
MTFCVHIHGASARPYTLPMNSMGSESAKTWALVRIGSFGFHMYVGGPDGGSPWKKEFLESPVANPQWSWQPNR